MTEKLLTLPLRLGFGAARTTIDVSAKTLKISARLAGTALDIVRPGGLSKPAAPAEPPEPPAAPAPKRRRSPRPDNVNGHSAGAPQSESSPAPETPVTPPRELPSTPLTHDQAVARTVEEEDEVVAEFAEPGAEDGAGAQLDAQEPWAGYDQMDATTVIARIDHADAAELALLELHEQTHKKRQTVLAAAARRLRTLSPPQAG